MAAPMAAVIAGILLARDLLLRALGSESDPLALLIRAVGTAALIGGAVAARRRWRRAPELWLAGLALVLSPVAAVIVGAWSAEPPVPLARRILVSVAWSAIALWLAGDAWIARRERRMSNRGDR